MFNMITYYSSGHYMERTLYVTGAAGDWGRKEWTF